MDGPLLIANRGEIALRVMRTARRLGYRCVAVYSEADADAAHRHAADQALCIGGAAPAASYLNIPALLEAARRSGARAVHPGYGFLAESADFARACAEAGLLFIGPPARAIEAMGNKAEAKRLMAAAGVACVPGYQGAEQSDTRLAEEAARIGYPVMVKAAAGGGGRGMRRVDGADGLSAALQAARSEAQNAFGSGELILERAISAPRHIEVQVFADAHGNVVHMGERDCSVQRRHQKLVEEAPSPAVSAQLRARMGATAVAAARTIGYVGAGTLEFLLDGEGNYYFMEMNTRLQVEHAVTEAITGIDLVEWQLLAAAGAPLPLSQEQLDARRAAGGHAIEVRLCAEDPARDFLPQSGTVLRWRAPGGVRCDHALHDGAVVPAFYDSMLAKLVAHGRDRADALRRLRCALDECLLLGVPSNRAFLARCLAHPAFGAGEATTAFIETHFPAAVRGAAGGAPASQAAPVAAVTAAGAAQPGALALGADAPRVVAAVLLAWLRGLAGAGRYPAELAGWSSSAPSPWRCRFALDGVAGVLRLHALPGGRWQVEAEAGAWRQVALAQQAPGCVELDLDGRSMRVEFATAGARCDFLLDGVEYSAQDLGGQAPQANGGGAAGGRIEAPMNGRIVALHVAQGDAVRAGQPLAALEAMKMEHSLLAAADGTVAELYTVLGAQVATGQLLLEIKGAS